MATTMTRPAAPRQLSAEDVQFYTEHGFLRLRGVFTPEEVAELSEDLDAVIENFATRGKGWSGPWRQQLMDATEEQQSVLVALHEIEMYAASWMRAIVKPRLTQSPTRTGAISTPSCTWTARTTTAAA